MKTNYNVRNISFKKVIFSTALIFGALTFSQAATSENHDLGELEYTVEISELKELPSIILVDKNLRIVAEFYGDSAEVKKQFEATFQNAERLSIYNNQSIYLALSH